jgi:pyroglutamyl-peptidase
MTGLAAGRTSVAVERIAVNCWRRAGDRGEGRPIRRGGPDGLFSTLPMGPCLRELRRAGLPASISESAGTYCCNLVLYEALLAARTEGPAQVGYLHLPATAESLPAGLALPCVPAARLRAGLRAACLALLRGERAG